MLYKNETAFAKDLAKGSPQGLYLLYGSESYLIQAYVKKISESFGGGFDAFNLQKLDGRKPNCDALLDAVETLPLMAGEKLVTLNDLDPKALSPEELDRFFEILGDLPSTCTLIITGRPPTFDGRTAAVKKLVKLCAEAGHAVELSGRSPNDMASWLQGFAKRNGCSLSSPTARHILATCETGMNALSGEMTKLCAYAKGSGGEITREMVDRVAIPRTEARVFDLSRAIQAGDSQKAFELLGSLFYLREPPLAILAVLSMSYADQYRARCAQMAGRAQSGVSAAFGYKGKEFRLNNAWNSRMSTPALRASLETLLECDRSIKSIGVSGEILLEQTVAKLLTLRGVRYAR